MSVCCEGPRQGSTFGKGCANVGAVACAWNASRYGGSGGLGALWAAGRSEGLRSCRQQHRSKPAKGSREHPADITLLEKCKEGPACKPRAWKTCWDLGLGGFQQLGHPPAPAPGRWQVASGAAARSKARG